MDELYAFLFADLSARLQNFIFTSLSARFTKVTLKGITGARQIRLEHMNGMT